MNTQRLAEDHAGRLSLALTASGMSQGELADSVGVGQPAVSMWVSGSRRPERTVLGKVAAVLGVSATWLDYGEGEGPRPDLAELRSRYQNDVRWCFRKEQPDGSRDYGNANIFSFKPKIATFVREVLQNIGDAGSGGPVSARFTVRRLRGADVDSFMAAMSWPEFRPHLEASIQSGQQVGSALASGLRAVDTRDLIVLEVADFGTTGLLGPDVGSGNFAALCRNNLDSDKATSGAGGSYGLGKAVFWRMSSLSTVLFLSNLVEPAPDSGGQQGRFIARTEMVWHKLPDGASFAGPGWLGAEDPAVPDRPMSYWGNEALARDLMFSRLQEESGTSIMVVGFRDPSTDTDQSPVQVADAIETAVAAHFWPALTLDELSVTVEVAEGSSVSRTTQIDIEGANPELADLLHRHRQNEVVEALMEPGDVVRIPVELLVPECLVPGVAHPAFVHTAYVLVRRADPADESPAMGRAQYTRGTGMVIFEADLSRVLVGVQPFHVAVLCGTAAGDSAEDLRAERFLRTAEPPAHDNWEITETLQREYARGSGAAVQRLMGSVRKAVREALAPAVDTPADGPRDLAALFKFGEPPKPERAPRLIVDSAHVTDQGAWSVEATIRVPNPDKRVVGRPVVLFEGETGAGARVAWAGLHAVKDCIVTDGTVVVASGKRTARFRGETDPSSHPVPAAGASISVDFRAVREEASE